MSGNGSYRVVHHPVLGALGPRDRVSFTFNGNVMEGFEGEPIAAALMAQGIWNLRRSDRLGEPRGIFCGIGHCYECRVTVNGQAGVRACLTPIRAGIKVESAVTPLAPAGNGADGQ